MNKQRRTKLVLLYTLLFLNSNTNAGNSDIKSDININISSNPEKKEIISKSETTKQTKKIDIHSNISSNSGKKEIVNKSETTKQTKLKSKKLPKFRPIADIRHNGKNEEISQQNEQSKFSPTIINALTILIACGGMWAILNGVPWLWDQAMKYFENNNLFRDDNYNDTTKIVSKLIGSDYKKFGIEFKDKVEDYDHKIDYVNLGKDIFKDGTYEVKLSNSEYHCIFLEPKFKDSNKIKIKVTTKQANQSVVIVTPVHVEVLIDASAGALDILRISSPSLCLGTDSDITNVKNAWWQDKTKVKDLYLDTDKKNIYYKTNKDESATLIEDFLTWIENNKNNGTTVEKLTFGPIYIKNT